MKKYPLVGNFTVKFPSIVRKEVTVKRYNNHSILQVLTVTGLLVQKYASKEATSEERDAFLNLFDGEEKIIPLKSIVSFGCNDLQCMDIWGALVVGDYRQCLDQIEHDPKIVVFDEQDKDREEELNPYRVYKYKRNGREHKILFCYKA